MSLIKKLLHLCKLGIFIISALVVILYLVSYFYSFYTKYITYRDTSLKILVDKPDYNSTDSILINTVFTNKGTVSVPALLKDGDNSYAIYLNNIKVMSYNEKELSNLMPVPSPIEPGESEQVTNVIALKNFSKGDYKLKIVYKGFITSNEVDITIK